MSRRQRGEELQQRLEDLVRETQDLKRALARQPKRGRESRPRSSSKRPKREEAPGRVKWVSAEDDAKSVGRLIVGAAMASAVVGFPVSLHAKYEANVNTALKGVAIATKRCAEEQGTYVACAPSFRENRNELTVTVVKLAGAPAVLDGGNVLTVARATDYRVLAGAVAKRARDDAASVLRAIGAAAVFAAARALATCREYLEQDGDDTDVVAVPRFSKVRVDGRDGETTVLELCVFPSTPATPQEDPHLNAD
ncbi:hypothetical protein CTAYLR_003443 [Chrysophaeum taylorii]|uniref:Uncharacterized protein n=1 Tax=Chrysophaeum taylorii TaxID=2483200 RepID=A0AAD7U878_9STRA|nr:hypothetical protein CTAYLR_003443 [Chrysophaeum taylorii]